MLHDWDSTVWCYKNLIYELFWLEENIEDSIRDWLIITATFCEILFVLKAANLKPAKAFLDVMDMMKLAGGIWGGVLVKYCTV